MATRPMSEGLIATAAWTFAGAAAILAVLLVYFRPAYFYGRPSIDGRLTHTVAEIAQQLSDGRPVPERLPAPVYYDRQGVRDLVAYERLSPRRYRLCARFEHPSHMDRRADLLPELPHVAGRTCFIFSNGSQVPLAVESVANATRGR